MDRFETLTAFVAVADRGGFAAAARALDKSPPAITRATEKRYDSWAATAAT